MSDRLSIHDVTVIVVTFNSAHCMAGLAQTLATLPHVAIVDNASADDTLAVVAREMPKAVVFRNSRNLGFGAANNIALRQASTSHALLLNPDCLISREAIDRLLDAATQYPDAAMIAPQLLRKDGGLDLSYRWPATHWVSRGAAADGPCSVGFVSGAAMLMNLQVMEEIGFFDETFFLYYEDEDLCQRIFLQGKQIILVPDARVSHLSRGSVRGPNSLRSEFGRGYHHVQSKLIFAAKHIGAHRANRLKTRTLALAFASIVPRLLAPAPRHVARLAGRICGLFAYSGAEVKRES
jgi:N-acetylglucosaminyl-diphospho-decaprenol L-rhamnosyltransferase